MHLRKGIKEIENVSAVLSSKEIIDFQQQIELVKVEDNLMHYIAELVNRTRSHPSLYLGASPRASLNTLTASKAYAAIQGRDFVIPEDIKTIIGPVLIHRIYLTPEKELEGSTEEQMVEDIVNSVEVPR